MKMHHRKPLAIGIFCAISYFAASQSFAQEDVISQRKALMKANNEAVSKSMKKAAEEKDYATVEIKAKEIMGNMDRVPDLFPKGSTSEKSRAHPDIWVKNDEFRRDAANAKKVAEELVKAAAAKNEVEVNIKLKELVNNRDGACCA